MGSVYIQTMQMATTDNPHRTKGTPLPCYHMFTNIDTKIIVTNYVNYILHF
jgi:hypothetical protein